MRAPDAVFCSNAEILSHRGLHLLNSMRDRFSIHCSAVGALYHNVAVLIRQASMLIRPRKRNCQSIGDTLTHVQCSNLQLSPLPLFAYLMCWYMTHVHTSIMSCLVYTESLRA